MFKVMCVGNVNQVRLPKEVNKKLPYPSIGELCSVTGKVSAFGATYYTLEDYGTVKYLSTYFAVIPEIDEMELVNEKELVQ